MEIYSPQLQLRGAWIEEHALNLSSSSKSKRYHVEVPDDSGARSCNAVVLDFADEHGAQTRAKVTLRRSRQLQAHGYESIDLMTVNNAVVGRKINAYRVLHEDRDVIVVLATPPAYDFMAHLPDSLALGDLTLPATHESCAFYGGPISQCQQSSTTLLRQLEDGIRFLDVRLKVKGDQLLAYHGPQSQHLDFLSILQIIHLFLQAHQSETLIMSIKEEIPPFHPLFSAMVERDISTYREDWLLLNRVPTLGEARGKAILFSRFERVQEKEWPDGIGMHPGPWPDSKPWVFEWDCSGIKVRVQDWYRLGSFLQIPEKIAVIIDSVEPCTHRDPSPKAPLTLSFTTASGLPLGLPTLMAKGFGWPSWGLGVRGINSRLCEWLLQCVCDGKQVRACLPMDYYRQTGEADQDLAAILVGMNFL